MFERFTERARKVVVLAQEEARHFNHNYIGTEHLLLGLLREDEGVAARALTSLNVTLDEVREQVESIVGYGEEGTGGQAPFTPRSKKVLELALREALQLGHNYIGTEHILLGLVRESEGVAARVLSNLDVGPGQGSAGKSCGCSVADVPGGAGDSRVVAEKEAPPAVAGARPSGRRPGSSTSTVATSRLTPRKTTSTRSSDAARRSSASCRSSCGAPRTTR